MATLWPRRVLAALVLCLLLIAGGQARKKEDSNQLSQDTQLIKSALDKVNIWAAGTPPFRLQATIKVHPGEKGAADYNGSLVLSWFAPGEWREAINLPEFSQVKISSKGKLSVVRNGHHALRAMEIEHLMDIRRSWTVWQDESVVQAKTKTVDGVEARCVEFQSKGSRPWQLCADSVSEAPVALLGGLSDGDSIRYGDYIQWGRRQIPRSIRSLKNGFVAIEIKVESVVPNGASPEAQLSLLQAGYVWESCDNPQPAKVLEGPHPIYPVSAKATGRQAREIVYLVVGPDGSVRNPQIVKSDGPDFDAATIRAVSQWKYQPAKCGSSPVPSEITTTVNYTLAY